MTDSPHQLLLGHFDRWSREKGRPADLDVLELLLDLRWTYDELDPAYWPTGSVEDLLLRLVPAKGPQESLPQETIAESLDSYFRFLRNTGRMAARSATPAELAKEARRSVVRMNEPAVDRANWSTGKVLTDFGTHLGICIVSTSPPTSKRCSRGSTPSPPHGTRSRSTSGSARCPCPVIGVTSPAGTGR
jgi:hypothetical protein